LGELLIRANLVTEKDVSAALQRQVSQGGTLGDNLVALGSIDARTIHRFIHRVPQEPADIESTGIADTDLLALFMKLMFSARMEKIGQISDGIKLPQHVVMDLANVAIERQLIYTLGAMSSDSVLDMRYAMTDEGKRWTLEVLQRSGYVGPAPVPLAEFIDRVNMQKPTNERVTLDNVHEAIKHLTMDETIVEQAGPALNSGRAILLYGPPGNGKTTVALSFASVFKDVIHVPYAITVEGQIIRFFDPRLHIPANLPEEKDDSSELANFRRDTRDRRWVTCKRPFVVAGGELTLDMLDLRYDEKGHYYEAPLHMKALGGCFLIDDFGRQFVAPRDLLNRWIVPMESRVDYLKLRSGASFSIPFEEIVIFATNLNPEDLMDPAFLRRLPYKIEVGPPGLEQFHRIFQMECARHNLTFNEEVFNFIVYLITKEKELELAGFQPTFIVEQITATCRFLGKDPELKSPYIEYAINNLRVRRNAEPRMERTAQAGAPAAAAATEVKKPVESAAEFSDVTIKQNTSPV
jgi:energy-coupling factor transporter ATP-binding protein EcfA2